MSNFGLFGASKQLCDAIDLASPLDLSPPRSNLNSPTSEAIGGFRGCGSAVLRDKISISKTRRGRLS